MKAMSYLTWSVARQGEYWMRPKVEIPEKTESAWGVAQLSVLAGALAVAYLSPSITWKSVVPQALVRSSERFLVVCVVAMGLNGRCQSSQSNESLQHPFLLAIDNLPKYKKAEIAPQERKG